MGLSRVMKSAYCKSGLILNLLYRKLRINLKKHVKVIVTAVFPVLLKNINKIFVAS